MPLGPQLHAADRTKIVFEGRPYLFFGGNDYHRLSTHPEVLQAAREALATEGLLAAGSRSTTGNHPLHAKLEARTADFLGAGETVLCADGYLSNTVAVEAFAPDFQRFFLDGSAHASLRMPLDRLPREQVHVFRHADPESLEQELRRHLRPGERPLVLSNGVESGSGELPPLAAYWEAVRDRGGKLLVDDAHGVGTLGLTGKGSPEEAQLPPGSFLQTGTFAKAFGGFGGLLADGAGLMVRVAGRSQTFIGATPVPPPVVAASLRALEILTAHPYMITDLRARTLRVRQWLRTFGLKSPDSPAPILSVTHHDEAKNQRLRFLLVQNGIFPTFTDYPGCPPGGHFRFTLSGLHTDEEIDLLLETIALSCE